MWRASQAPSNAVSQGQYTYLVAETLYILILRGKCDLFWAFLGCFLGGEYDRGSGKNDRAYARKSSTHLFGV
jgi:hypothetical protein